jgi:hypothetical protein
LVSFISFAVSYTADIAPGHHGQWFRAFVCTDRFHNGGRERLGESFNHARREILSVELPVNHDA